MLMNLQVRDFAIIEKIEIEFEPGMTVLTGETGAGKSILVDALGLVLGERGSAQLVRSGAKRAEFSAEFDVSALELVRAWLVASAGPGWGLPVAPGHQRRWPLPRLH